MTTEIIKNPEYKKWFRDLKLKVRTSQIKAAVRVNTGLLSLYWELGEMIIRKQAETDWGDKLIEQLSSDLSNEFPGMKGFSRANLFYIVKWVRFYSIIPSRKVQQLVASLPEKVQQLAGQLPEKVSQLVRQTQTNEKQEFKLVQQLVGLITWSHNIQIITKCKNLEEALFYVIETLKNDWSRSVLVHQIESDLFKRQGNAITNFEFTLPKPQSDLANELIKDPYNLDFILLAPEANERELENKIIDNITKFLLELGSGFAYIGRQHHIEVSRKDFYTDLLFYHTVLHCYIAFDLKIGEFMPEHAGKMNFYLSAIDDLIKTGQDNPSIGIILCKTKNKIIAEYSLRDMTKPIGISEYKITSVLPDNLKGSLPTAEDFEEVLK